MMIWTEQTNKQLKQWSAGAVHGARWNFMSSGSIHRSSVNGVVVAELEAAVAESAASASSEPVWVWVPAGEFGFRSNHMMPCLNKVGSFTPTTGLRCGFWCKFATMDW